MEDLLLIYNFIVNDIAAIVLGIILILQFFAIISVIASSREISSKHSWILILSIIPIVGYLIYLFFGKHTKNPGTKNPLQIKDDYKAIGLKTEFEENGFISEEEKNDYLKLIRLIHNSCNSSISSNNELKILQNGEEKFKELLEDIRAAKYFIHMSYFIWRDDNLTQIVKDELINAANRGIEVRILVDHLGSLLTPMSYFFDLRKHGIKFEYSYSFIGDFIFNRLNYRDHRKIVIIDGLHAYLGGINMGEEYVSGGKQFKMWRDTHLKITGGQVKYLQNLFSESWEEFTGEKLIGKYYPLEIVIPENNSPVQIVTSGPDSPWNSIEQSYLNMISNANESIYLQSPYFVPSESMLDALTCASLSGIKVKVMLTGVPDKKLPFWAANRFIREVLEAGVEVYQYKKGFMHAKTLIVDSKFCSIGSANMDIRSFRLNYEINAVIFDEKLTKELELDYQDDIDNCEQVFLHEERFNNKLIAFRDEVCALLAPIL